MRLPNFLITGTPGTGKTTIAEMIAEQIPELKHLNVSELVKSEGLYEEFDENLNTHILDDEAFFDYFDPLLEEGGYIVDFHTPDMFKPDHIDHVFVVHCINDQLWKRLENRGYSEQKIKENLEAEIMMVCYEDSLDIYGDDIVNQVTNESIDQLDSNVEEIVEFIKSL
eukprot:TRINITY_DN726_c0_g1_i1.p1 TRINITY_DN726_c0_g1~~TRINITY_DN726_c0_g1_i1.p1  ORF type:complete len:168 (+),score=43.64 TRINITY_DN726_c0_g1_i1:32-535(+)